MSRRITTLALILSLLLPGLAAPAGAWTDPSIPEKTYTPGSPPAGLPPTAVFLAARVYDMELSPNGARLYAATRNGITVLDTTSWKAITTFATGAGKPFGLELLDNGATLAAAMYGTGKVIEIDTATGSITATTQFTAAELGPVYKKVSSVVDIGNGRLMVGVSTGEDFNGGEYGLIDRADPAHPGRTTGIVYLRDGAAVALPAEGLAFAIARTGGLPPPLVQRV
ncbi:MAG: hypothetical protein R2695_18040, partial [Acidimicrobiales bacterium]